MRVRLLIWSLGAIFVFAAVWQFTRHPSPLPKAEPNVRKISVITIDYPLQGTVFPPEFPPPVMMWRDPGGDVSAWRIEIGFGDGTAPLRIEAEGAPLSIGRIDPRTVSSSNKKPELSAKQAAAHTWTPTEDNWSAIKAHSVDKPATIVITGYSEDKPDRVISRGKVSVQTSKDLVGAPVFYRDVPLMPSENEKGVIKPLAPEATKLIAWKLRNVGEKESRLLMDGIHTCANCHSFSANGKTLGMDMDGPRNDKGLYALVDVAPQMTISNDNLVTWSTFRGKLGSRLRVGFMSQLSPDAQHVITTVNDPGIDQTDFQRHGNPVDLIRNYYVANFKDYRFLQVFFPTRGVLAWYSRDSGLLNYLPGADDTQYVHNNAVWSPDGTYLVFARAKARDAYPEGATPAQFAGDPNEHQLQYDLYRIPFNDGKGGTATRIEGASQNGMSNSFPKISPDGKWIVFVQSKNGMLMRPDSQLFIVPAEGGVARRMNCNTPLMNSWHSFSPNSKWLVFSSKSRSPYTQLYLTHIDEKGNDSPAILIENTTAANRAANIPEFVNIPGDGMLKINAPAAEYAEHLDGAIALMNKKDFEAAISEWQKALALAPNKWHAHNSLGVALMETGKIDDAIAHYQEALAIEPEYPEACNNLGEAFLQKGKMEDAIAWFGKAVKLNPNYAVAHSNLGTVLAQSGKEDEAIVHLKKTVEISPDSASAHRNLGHALASAGYLREATDALSTSVKLSGGRDPLALHLLGRVLADMGDVQGAVLTDQQALQVASAQNNTPLIQAINAHLIPLLQQQ
ncbi:MAG: tetratricopeptide repeat protein [Deltaproteobacteria bacterium]|nr:tetratricopeptide repeat protein [Deltaproteobacteria bacterium]